MIGFESRKQIFARILQTFSADGILHPTRARGSSLLACMTVQTALPMTAYQRHERENTNEGIRAQLQDLLRGFRIINALHLSARYLSLSCRCVPCPESETGAYSPPLR